MKLVTFENSARQSRIGALFSEDRIVDLHTALRTLSARRWKRNHFLPPSPTLLFRLICGHCSGAETQAWTPRAKALDHVARLDANITGPRGETVLYQRSDVQLKAPIIPKKFFHTAGNFREHHEEATKAGFSHPVMPWIVFLQNTDAIIGPDEPVIYPEHLTQELDYELELAVVLKKRANTLRRKKRPATSADM